jgi:hypothetical protein
MNSMSSPKQAAATSVPPGLADQLRQRPIHAVLVELCASAREARVLRTAEFRKLVAYLLEYADGRDRREPWTNRPGVARPIAKVRIAIEKCFGMYADLHWFKLNKTANASSKPLIGLFPRMAATLWRVKPDDFGAIIDALLSKAPDTALLKLLSERGGKIHGLGVEGFSRLAFALRPDEYFVFPRPWGESTGCLDYIDGDLRRYCALCRNLRTICDDIGFPGDVRGSMVEHLLKQPKAPTGLLKSLHRAIGPSLAKYTALEPDDAHQAKTAEGDDSNLMLDFAARCLRGRRGRRDLREMLCRLNGVRCVFTGTRLKDLLEVAYIAPYPSGELHSTDNALLMRSDLHTLWDLNLIGVEPTTRCISIARRLEETTYARLAGRTMWLPRQPSAPLLEGLRERWRMFEGAHPNAIGQTELADESSEETEEVTVSGQSRPDDEVASEEVTSPPERLRAIIETESSAVARFAARDPAEVGNGSEPHDG